MQTLAFFLLREKQSQRVSLVELGRGKSGHQLAAHPSTNERIEENTKIPKLRAEKKQSVGQAVSGTRVALFLARGFARGDVRGGGGLSLRFL